MERSTLPLSSAACAVRTSVFAELQGRIDSFKAAGGELIPLHIGDTYLPPPAAALRASEGAHHRELSVYGGVAGLPELRAALAARLQRRGLALVEGPQNVHVACGCTHALFCACRAILNPGDEVLVASPYWPLITGVLQTCELCPVEIPLSGRCYREPALDVAAILAAAITPKTRAIYLITPNNPDGQIYTRQQLEAVAAVALANDLWVLSDEVYADFSYSDAELCSIANLPGMAERTITSFSLSKSHALAGARIGYVAASPRVIDAVRRISNHTVYNVPVAMQRAALAALQDDSEWLAEARAIYRQARDATCAALGELGLAHDVPKGGSFVFLDLADRLGTRPLRELLELAIDRGVLLAPGEAFGAGYERFVRLCFTGAPLDQVLLGIKGLGEALEALP